MCYNLLHKTMIVGAVGVIWAIMWYVLVYDSPAQHPHISTKERQYIEKALDKTSKSKVKVSHVIV